MRLERIIAIIMLLLEHKKISATKLADMLEVTPRTIYRDIDSIDAAGIPIITFPGVNGGISIMEEYKIEKRLFTMSDITSLLVGLGSIPLSSEEILNTILKIKSLIPTEQIGDIENKTNQIVVDYTSWQGDKTIPNNIEKIKSALSGCNILQFQYSDHISQGSFRIVEPYRLILKQTNWYLQAYCRAREDFRNFRISRISSIEILEEKFIPREFKHDTANMPKITQRKTKVTLLIDACLLDVMTDFCGQENITIYDSKRYIVNYLFLESDHGYGFLLHFGNKCECIRPKRIRQEVARRARDLLALYQE